MPDTRQVAELFPATNEFIEDISRNPAVLSQFGEDIIIHPEIVLYKGITREEAYAIGTLICGVIESDVEFRGTDTMNGLAPIIGESPRPFTAFSTTTLDSERLKSNARKAIMLTNSNLALIQSLLRI